MSDGKTQETASNEERIAVEVNSAQQKAPANDGLVGNYFKTLIK